MSTKTSTLMAIAVAVGVGLMGGRAEAQAWTPTNLPGLALWLDAGDTNTVLRSGSSVTNWMDKSGNGRNATQSSASLQPANTPNALNGNPAITFDGSDDYLIGNLPDSVFPSNITLIHVFVPLSTAATKGMLQIASGLTSGGPWLLQQQDATSYKHYVNSGYQITETIATNSPFLSVLTYSGSQWISWLNGTQGAAYTGGRGSLTGNSLYLGNGYNGYWNGRFAEVIATTNSLSTADRQKAEGYLAWKWGLATSLPSGHPYQYYPPSTSSVSSATGGDVTNSIGGYQIHMFTNAASSTFSVSSAGTVDYLIVGGGGGGGSGFGGGGGAGGMIMGSLSVTGGTYNVVVGGGGGVTAGGAGGTGTNSSFAGITAYGGGGGGGNSGSAAAKSGGSGGGGSRTSQLGGLGTGGQGNNGGTGGAESAGGGGGAGEVGQPGQGGNVSGRGGDGKASSMSGTTNYYAQGGCGFWSSPTNNPNRGGGGNAVSGQAAQSGTPNTGGGGGGDTGNGSGAGRGGSGIVIIRYYPTPSSALSVSVTAPTAGQAFLSGSSVTATVSVAGGQSPYTVTFYTNSASAWSTNNATTNLFSIPLGVLPIGTYTNYAKVTDNASATNFSATNTFTVVTPPTSFYWTSAASGLWGTAGNWTNDAGIIMAPVSPGQTNYTLNFNNAATYTASNSLNAGFLLNQLNFGGAAATLSGFSMAFTNNGATLPQVNQNSAAAVTVNNDLLLGADTTFGGSGAGTVTVAGAMSGPGGLTKTGTGTLAIGSTNNTYSGSTVISNGTVKLPSKFGVSPVALYTFDNAADLGADTSGNGYNMTVSNTPSQVTGISGSAISLNNASSQYLELSGASWASLSNRLSTGTGQTLVMWLKRTGTQPATDAAGGILKGLGVGGTFDHDWQNNTGNAWYHVFASARIDNFAVKDGTGTNVDQLAWHMVALVRDPVNGRYVYYNPATGSASAAGSAAGASTLALGSVFDLGKNNNGTYFGGIMDQVALFDKALTTTQLAQLYSNPSILGNAGALPSSTALSIASGATFDLSGNPQTVGSLSDSGGGGGVVTNSNSTSATLTINPSSGSTSFSGSIRGGISLVKSGIGTQVLAGASGYSGGTTVSNGALLVNGSITGTVNVISGATLGGTGAITGNVTFASGALALFTNGVPLTFTGPVTLNNNVVHLTLPDSLPDGTYLLSTNTSGNFSGSFAATPVIDSGSTVGSSRTITTDAGAVRLVLTSTFTITLLPASLPAGTQGVAYSQTIIPGGGTAPYTNTVIAGSLPSGLTLAENGLLSGIPDTAGLYSFTVQAKDAAGYTGSNAYSVTIYSVPASFFWTNTVSGGWDVAGNWTNDVGTVAAPASAGQTNYTLNFNNAGTYTASNNLSSGFLLNQLNFGGATVTLAGNSMAFTNNAAALPHINQNSAAAVTVSNAIVLGANATLGGSGAGTVTVAGVISGANSLTMTHAGTLTLSGDNNLTGLFSAQAGTVVNTANWVGNGRGQQKAQVGGSATAALWTNTIPLTIGSGAAGVSNTFTVASQGVLRVNGGITVGTNAAAFNSLVVTNGGQAFSTNAASWIGAGGSSNSVQVLGVAGSGSTLWDLGGWAGTIGRGASTGNVLLVSGPGAVVTNVGITGGRSGSYNGLTLGYFGESSSGNSLIISNGGQVVVNSGWALTDLDASGNRILVDNGTLTAPAYIVGWANSGAAYGLNNTLTVTNGGAVTATGTSGLALGNGGPGLSGYGSSSNTVVVAGTNSLGAMATISLNGGNLWIGNASGTGPTRAANGNLVLIGNGGIITNAGAVTVGVGSSSAGNSLIVTSGGQLFSTNASVIGSAGDTNSTLVIGGSGGTSRWSLGGQTLTIGSGGGVGNVLRIDGAGVTGGAVVANGGLIVGSGGSRNSVVVTNGAQVVFANDSRVGSTSGSSALSNTLKIATATYTGGSNRFHVGWADGGASSVAAFNQILVGAGGLMTNVGYLATLNEIDFTVGAVVCATAYSNQMVVTDGGKVFTLGNLAVGRIFNSAGSSSYVASSNSLLIANGGLVNVPGGFFLGADSTAIGYNAFGTASFNSLTITNGGQLITGANSYIGLANASGSVMNNNTATIGGSLNGTNAAWNLGGKNLYVGNRVSGTATGNVLTVTSGGVVTNVASLVVPATNTLSLLAGGQIYGNAATNAGTLTVGIDDTATPACGRLTVSGDLNITGATLSIVTNGAPNGSTYVIASCGTLTGTFAVTNGVPYGYRLNCTGNQIALEPIPPPTLVSLNPANNATEIPLAPALAATFNTNIALVNGGVITLTNLTAGATFATITLPDPQVTTNGAVLTITPASSLAYSSQYAVLIGTNAVKGLDTITMFAGITNDTTWRFTTMSPGVSILNQAASALTPTSATFNATLAVPAGNADVQVFWGPTDGTNNPVAWATNAYVGSWTNVTSTNISFTTNGLAPDTRYYYTFRATNATTSVWGSPSTTFATLRPLAAAARYWDGGTTNIPSDGDGISQGNSGTWNATTQNWDAGVSSHVAWDNTYSDVAIFAGTAGLVTLASGVTVGGLQFDTAGYVLTNNILTFGAAGSLAVNADATLFTPIAGSAAVAKTGAGTLTSSGDNTLTGLFSVQAGTLANTANWVGNGRSQQKVQVGGAGAAALWTNSIGMTIGTGAAGVSNTFMVASQGVLRVNGGIMVGTNAAAFNSLVVTNGGQAFSTNGASTIGFNATNNSVLVIGGSPGGGPSLVDLGGQPLTIGIGTGGNDNVLKIDGNGVAGGAVATNLATIVIGLNASSTGNSLMLTNGAQLFTAPPYATYLGIDCSANSLTVVGGAASSVYNGGGKSLIIGMGNAGSSAYNLITIGAGGLMTNIGVNSGYNYAFAVGWTGGSGMNAVSNRLAVTDGGKLFVINDLQVGSSAFGGKPANGNTVLIANTGAVNVAGGVVVGYGNASAYNSLTITNGGQLSSGAASAIGQGYNGNTATIVGGSAGSSLWNLGNQTLTVGSASATGNVLTVGSGGVVTNLGSLTVAATNRLSLLAGGQVYASAATNAGTLTVGLDDAVTPACGHLTVSGNLNIAGATLTFDVTGTPAQAVYVIASYGTLTGTFAATNGLPPDGSIVYDFGGAKQVALVVQARGTVFRFR